ncbi:MAG: glycosyltransferase family A protein [Spirochaetales bacterium]
MLKKIKATIILYFLNGLVCIITPVLFFIAKKSLKKAEQKISLAILCLAKNNANRLKKNLRYFDKMQPYFSDFKVLIYENNSIDATKKILNEAKKIYPFLEVYSFDYSEQEINAIAPVKTAPQMTPCRIQHIAYGRNFLLQKLKEKSNAYEYTLVFDCDALYFNPFKAVKLAYKFVDSDIDVLSVNGLTKMLKYRDGYAFRSKHYPYGPEYLGEIWWTSVLPHIQKRFFTKKLMPVYSAFGGAAVYKTKTYTMASYSALPTDDFIEMQKKFVHDNPHVKDFDKVANPEKPMPNTGYTDAVICEHVPFHYTLYKKGYTKQFVDTSWKMLFL